MQKTPSVAADGRSIVERLLQVYGCASLPQLAAAMGEDLSTVKGWKQRGSVPINHCVHAAEATNCSLDWLVMGKGQMRKTTDAARQSVSSAPAIAGAGGVSGHPPLGVLRAYLAEDGPAPWRVARAPANPQSGGDSGIPADVSNSRAALLVSREAGAARPLLLSLPSGEQGGPIEEYELIPKHMRTALAGGGSIGAGPDDDHVDLVGEMAFSFDWMRRNLGHTTGRLTTIQVRGDSMATTLLDGDTIVIDEGVQVVEVDGIYVLDVYGRRLVKRVQHLVDGTLVLISDNQSYQRETISRSLAREVRVIGRMVWPRVR